MMFIQSSGIHFPAIWITINVSHLSSFLSAGCLSVEHHVVAVISPFMNSRECIVRDVRSRWKVNQDICRPDLTIDTFNFWFNRTEEQIVVLFGMMQL